MNSAILNQSWIITEGKKSQDPPVDECPICKSRGAVKYLSAPDRLHGRRMLYTLMQCQACLIVWLSRPPRCEEMGEHYTEAYHQNISRAGDNPGQRWKVRKESLLQYKHAGNLLDLGCSSGSFLEYMGRDCWRLYGVEMSAETAKKAEARCGAEVYVGNITDAPFAPESFDAITCFDVLEHLYEPLAVMRKVKEWLKPGGIFYVQVPNIQSAESRVFKSYWQGLELPRHLFHYSPESLRNLMKVVSLSEVMLQTRRNPAIGTGIRYMWSDVLHAVGVEQTPIVYRGEPKFAWRAARYVVRRTLLRVLLMTAPVFGAGEAIHAIFQKGIEKSQV
jgi:2-polyprenyl-3-methyl-5-hydroxy-6-metoxy-1,4-benzoquinol methylase